MGKNLNGTRIIDNSIPYSALAKVDWLEVIQSTSTVTLDLSYKYIKYTETEDATWVLNNAPSNVAESWTIKVILSSTAHTITLPANFYQEGTTKATIAITGAIGDVKIYRIVKDGSTYEIIDEAGGSSSTSGPAIAETYPDIATRDADEANREAGEIVKVTDASGDATVDSGYAYYAYEGSSVWRKLSEEESMDLEGSGETFETWETLTPVSDVITLDANKNETKSKTSLAANTSFLMTTAKSGSFGLLRATKSTIDDVILTFDPAYTHYVRQDDSTYVSFTTYTMKGASGSIFEFAYNVDGTNMYWSFPYRSIVETFAALTYSTGLVWDTNKALFPNKSLTLTGNVSSLTISNSVNPQNGTLILNATGANRTFSIPGSATHKMLFNNGVKDILVESGKYFLITYIFDGTNYYWTGGKEL